MNLKSLSNNSLTDRLRKLSQTDLKLTAEIVVHIHEFMTRRLYLDHGSTGLFAYLVGQLGDSRATAQNRIDAARLLGDVPEIGLGQITLMSMEIRQAEKENPGQKVSVEQKRELVERLKAVKSGRNLNRRTTKVSVLRVVKPNRDLRRSLPVSWISK